MEYLGAPAEIYKPKGMIGPEERRALYWLVKNWHTGGPVVRSSERSVVIE
jgi:hypothetical protein